MSRVHSAFLRPHRRLVGGALLALLATGCGGEPSGEAVRFVVPTGAGFSQVVDTLEARGVVGATTAFKVYARLRGADRAVRSGRYEVPTDMGWGELLDVLTEGRIVPSRLTFPEGWTLWDMAPVIAEFTGVPQAEVDSLLWGEALVTQLGLPGPTLEGYLFPDTYLFADGLPPEAIIETMADAYLAFWTPERRALLEASGRTERELVTLASIVQVEAGNMEEMPRIAGVYSNRLADGWLLQADPTVMYALGGPRERLLFAAIDSVADNPYNTYRQPGLPPGPIAAPGQAALDAALSPEDVPFMYFVLGPDGGHVFSETLAEHNAAVADYRRRRAEARGAR